MNKAVMQLIFTSLVFIVLIFAAIEARTFKETAMYFPFYISLLGIILFFIEIIRQVRKLKEEMAKGELLHPNIKRALKFTGILTIFFVLVYLIGLIPATAIYVFAFLYFIAKMKIWQSLLTCAILVTFLTIFGKAMNLYWPKSLFF